jgi:tetratricopeptide (TPR) repeat protein
MAEAGGSSAGQEKTRAFLKFGAQAYCQMQLQDAEKAFRQAADLASAAGDFRLFGRALFRLHGTLGSLGRMEEGKALVFAALEKSLTDAGQHHAASVMLKSCALRHVPLDSPDLPRLLGDFMQSAERAENLKDVDVARALGQAVMIANALGKRKLAASMLERAVPVVEAALGPAHAELAMMLYNLADLRGSISGYEATEQQMRRAIAIQEATLAPGHHERAVPLLTLGMVTGRSGRHAEARTLLDRALAIAVGVEGADGHTPTMVRTARAELEERIAADPASEPQLLKEVEAAAADELGVRLARLCRHYFLRGEAKKAEPHYRKLLALQEKLSEMESAVLQAEMGVPGKIYVMLGEGRGAEAEKFLMTQWKTMEMVLPPDHGDVMQQVYFTGNFYRMLGRHADALKMFERFVARDRKRSKPDDPGLAKGLGRVLDALLELGRGKDAARIATEIERLTGAKPQMDAGLNEIARQLQAVWRMLQLEKSPDLVGAAMEGDPLAGLVVGLCFAVGQGVPCSMEKARPWLDAAAKSGDATVAMFIQELESSADQPADFNMIASAAKAWAEASAGR